MATQLKQHVLLETNHFGLQELRFHMGDGRHIDIGTMTVNLHYVGESLRNKSFTILINDTKVITEISIRLEGKTIQGVLVPMNKSVLQYRPYDDFYCDI